MRTGVANLPLHYGTAPPWLFERMTKLSREITIFVVTKFGPEEFIKRLSHPVWFQSLGCVLGFDWHSSGLTTTTCGAIKEGLKGLEKDLGVYVCGGKGRASRKTPEEIQKKSNDSNHRTKIVDKLVYASRISAKVDNTALQDGYQLYHHNFFFTLRKGEGKAIWTVVQQGMNTENRMARRYHWFSEEVEDFVEEPESAVCCDKKGKPLNLVAKKSFDSRKAIAFLSGEKPEKNLKNLKKIVFSLNLPQRHQILAKDLKKDYLSRIFLKTYQLQPEKFEDLLMTRGVGPKTLRALTLLAEVLYGVEPSYKDPVRYSFAHGGKDGIPYPVDREIYDESINILEEAIRRAKISLREKDGAFRRLNLL